MLAASPAASPAASTCANVPQGDAEALQRSRDATPPAEEARASASVLGADELRCVFTALLTVDNTGRSIGRCVLALPRCNLLAQRARRESRCKGCKATASAV
jgi:hypothetical protein